MKEFYQRNTPFTSVIVRLSEAMPNDLCIFFNSAMLFFVNFTSVSSTDLGKKFSCDCPV